MITSLANDRIKHLAELEQKARTRNKEKMFVAEGFKMFEEAPIELIKEIYIEASVYAKLKEPAKKAPSDIYGRVSGKLSECESFGIRIETVSEEVFKKASDTMTPQGIIFTMTQMSYSLENLLKNKGNFLILEDIQDPGNLGTMIRTAEGAGMAGVIMTGGTVDIFNPKTIRSTMGSLYRVPFLYTGNIEETVMKLKAAGVKVYAAHLKGEKYYDEQDYEGVSAFLIGNEGNGLTDATAALADVYIRIPMAGKLESLNAAVAAAILMYRASTR